MSSAEGSKRASEVTSAMLNVPGYADDTMLFMMRWGSMAQATLRKVDYDELMVRLSALNKHWYHSQNRGKGKAVGTGGNDQGDDGQAAPATTEAASCGDDTGGGVQTDDDAGDPLQAGGDEARAAELRARTLELVEGFPLLVRDFDKFVDCTRIMATKYGRAPV